jgi:hypothetical protein
MCSGDARGHPGALNPPGLVEQFVACAFALRRLFRALGRRRDVWHRVTMPQPPPSNRQVRDWLDDWELPAPPRVQPLTGGLTSHVWRIDVGESVYVAKLAYQPRADVDNGLRAAAILARHGLRTGPALLTRAGQLTRLVEYPARHWHALSVLRLVEASRSTGVQPRRCELPATRWARFTASSWRTAPSNSRTSCWLSGRPQRRGLPARSCSAIRAQRLTLRAWLAPSPR